MPVSGHRRFLFALKLLFCSLLYLKFGCLLQRHLQAPFAGSRHSLNSLILLLCNCLYLKWVISAEAFAAPTATAQAAAAAAGATPTPVTPPVSPGPPQASTLSPLWSASPKRPAASADGSHQPRHDDDEVAGHRTDDGADSPLVPSSEDGDAAAAELDIWQKAHEVGWA